MTDQLDRLLTVEQVSQVMGLRETTVRKMVYEGTLPVVRPTGRRAVRFRLSAIEHLLQARSKPPFITRH